MFANCTGLKGRTLGLIGAGAIGQAVCQRARAFDLNVLVWTLPREEGLDKKLGFVYADSQE